MKKYDFHVHILDNDTNVEESIRYFRELCQRNGLEGVCIQALEWASPEFCPDCNEKALAIAQADPNWYAFAGLRHGEDYVEQTKRYMDQGFRGIKLLHGKPSTYRYYGFGYENPRFEPFFAYAEEQAIPLVIHNNDPLMHWDIHKISPSSRAKGWYYDSTFPPQEYFFQTLEEVLARHPDLHAAIAHMGFYSDNIPRAEKLMEQCPNLYMDMTPALIIYDELSETPEQTKAFLQKYHRRLLYGSDVSNRIEGKVRELNDRKTRIMDVFYTETGTYSDGGHTVRGMGLEESILEDIFYNNAMDFMGITK